VKSSFHLTPEILHAASRIERLVGRIERLWQRKTQPHLRRSNPVRAIQGSTHDLGQVTALREGKRVVGRKEEIRQVVNATKAYEGLAGFDPFSVNRFSSC
jgi:hypothetical protein